MPWSVGLAHTCPCGLWLHMHAPQAGVSESPTLFVGCTWSVRRADAVSRVSGGVYGQYVISVEPPQTLTDGHIH